MNSVANGLLKKLRAGLCLCALIQTGAHAQQMVASTWVPQNHSVTRVMMQWAQDVRQATAGRVSFTLLPKPATSPPGTFDAVRDGVIDLGFTVHGYTPGRFTLTTLAELPFVGDSSEAVSVAYQKVYEKHLAQAGEHKGVKVLAVFTHGPGTIYNVKRPVQSLQDLAGLKFRVGGGMVNEIGKAIGANVTLKPAPESYELLSAGVMDGVFFPAESIEAYRLDKLIRHVTRFPGGLYNTSFVMMMNERRWNELSEADQRAIDRLSGVALARAQGRGWDEGDRKGFAYMQASGVTITEASPALVKEIRGRTLPLEQHWVEAAQRKGIKSPEAALREFRGLAAGGQ